MKQVATVIIVAICLAASGMLLRSCGYHAGEHDQALRAAGVVTDRHRAELVSQIANLEARVHRDSGQHAADIAQLQIHLRSIRRRADSLEAIARGRPLTDSTTLAAFDEFHVLLDSLEVRHRADSLQTLFWQGVAAERARQRDSTMVIADSLGSERDAWQKAASRSLGCTIGPSGTAGLAGAGIFSQSTVGWGASIGLGITCGIRLK